MLALKNFTFYFLKSSVLEGLAIVGLSFGLSWVLDSSEPLAGAVILGLILKSSLISLQRSWYEHIFFHKKIALLGSLIFSDIILCSIFVATGVSSFNTHWSLWFFFTANVLLVKSGAELLVALQFSGLSVRVLSCVIFTPWFIILKSGLESSGELESWLLCGSWFSLVALSGVLGPIFLRWAFVPCEWRLYKCEDF